jgi:endonuclease/exonuclease/phosphatase family metal-dependent hydrolase
MSRFKIVSYNMRKGKGATPQSPPRLEEISWNLGRLEPDVLLCQEVFHGNGDESTSQSREIAESLDLLHRYEPNAEYRRGHHGNATFSRFHIVEHWNQDISTNRVEQRGLLYTKMELEGGRHLHVFNTHLGLSHRQRRIQARWLSSLVRQVADPADSVILAGDFNDWSGLLDSLVCSEAHMDNAMLALAMKDRRTWSTRRPLFALDRVYYRNLHLVEVTVLRGSPWNRLSDHFPVQVVVEVPRSH